MNFLTSLKCTKTLCHFSTKTALEPFIQSSEMKILESVFFITSCTFLSLYICQLLHRQKNPSSTNLSHSVWTLYRKSQIWRKASRVLITWLKLERLKPLLRVLEAIVKECQPAMGMTESEPRTSFPKFLHGGTKKWSQRLRKAKSPQVTNCFSRWLLATSSQTPLKEASFKRRQEDSLKCNSRQRIL